MIYTVSYEAPLINRSEILRYAGVKYSSAETEALLDRCLDRLDCFSYRVCYTELPAKNIFNITSETLNTALRGCDSAVVFAATVGIEIDRLIARYSAVSPAMAVMLQAMGAERVESLCNTFCKDIARGRSTKPRVSAGYGDLPLELQKDIFAMLDCPKRIGLTLNESLLMSPSKSVTAIFGVKNENT